MHEGFIFDPQNLFQSVSWQTFFTSKNEKCRFHRITRLLNIFDVLHRDVGFIALSGKPAFPVFPGFPGFSAFPTFLAYLV